MFTFPINDLSEFYLKNLEKKTMKKQNFIKSSVILIVSVAVAKAAGAFFRIPLANMLGGNGMAYFSGAYGIFLPVYAVFVTGLSSASAKLTAEYTALYGSIGTEKVRKYSLIIFSLTGIVGTAVMIMLAHPFAVYAAGSEDIYLSVLAISPAVLFSCVTAAYRGCAEGKCNMYPTAVSQIAESLVKLGAGLFLCMTIIKNEKYFLGIFSDSCSNSTSVAAAGAALGVTLSSLAGMVYMAADDFFRKKESREKGFLTCSISTVRLVKDIILTVVPLAASALLSNLTSVADLCTVMRFVGDSAEKFPDYFRERYDVFSKMDVSDFAEFAYGSYSGMAVTVFNLVPSFTNMFGKSIFPIAAEAWARKDYKKSAENSEKVLKATTLAAVPAGLGIFVLAERILIFLFPSSVNEVLFSVSSLRFLGIAMIFLCISFPVFSLFQAFGKAGIPARIMFAGLIVKTAGNIVLIRIPELNAAGAALSTVLCYFFVLAVSLAVFKRSCKIKLGLFRVFAGPVYSGMMCMAAAWLAEQIAGKYLGNTAVLFVSVIFGGVAYISSVFLLGEYKNIKEVFFTENTV